VATKMSKADRMSTSESMLGDIDITDIVEIYNDIATHISDFEDARQEAQNAFAEALGYHEEREWDSRNDSLSNAEECVERMREALDNIDDDSNYITFPEDRLPLMQTTLETIEQNVGMLVEA
jgi:hypothetical protein